MLILHGDNQIASRQIFLDSKKDGLILDEVTIDRLRQAIESKSLFGENNQAIAENIFSARPSNQKKIIIEYLKDHQTDPVLIWENKDVTAQLKEFDIKIIRRFDLPKYIFSFLDHPTISGLHQLLQTMSPEQILASLATRAHKQANVKWLNELLTIDYRLKTGLLPYNLTTALELWVSKS